ncbi:thiolase family protein [Aestuariirhabdus litorea]|uniref:Thiolase family protein n=1 Tax=Aestuariirhabdus litorea TaxID=2528527 RepID=A0A3P3VKF1_9GAMM|nr:thiolase family protein [Aestuariirhabdus litorea]RRJ83211.1 thiolase family protein [Aestuariirhabdus litorea]RWW93368.1 thiolase family protein [Endozoicomonadaceae bacterium GTF-13]
MKMNAYVAGVGMTPFGKHLETSLKGLAGMAIRDALRDAGIEPSQVEAAYMGNGAGGVVQGQEMISGQVALRELGIGKIPVVNVENACATSSTAFQQACAMVSAGLYDRVLVCGFEKLFHEDKARTFAAFDGAVDTEKAGGLLGALQALADQAGETVDVENAGKSRSVFMDIYSLMAKAHMKRYGTTREQIAGVTAKNAFHGSLNPRAQFQQPMSVEAVLAAREIVDPLTLPMCSPIGDGAAAIVVVSERVARTLPRGQAVRVRASALVSGWDQAEGDLSVGALAATQAYECAGIGPDDLSLIELHDASAPSELIAYEYLGICDRGMGGRLIDEGVTRLGGRLPVNVSGGLLRKGHPIGASGAAQIVELTEQLRGASGRRQVANVRIGLAHNGGGMIGLDAAATVVSILARED